MEFYTEYNKKQANWYAKQLKEFQDKINNPTETELDLWSIGTDIEQSLDPTKYNIRMISHQALNISMTDKISVEEYDDLFQEIESTFNDYDYFLDLNYTDEWYTSGQKYKFENKDGLNVYLYLESASCEYKKTGKMVPETKTDCSFIKD